LRTVEPSNFILPGSTFLSKNRKTQLTEKEMRLIIVILILSLTASAQNITSRTVYQDNKGVLRWSDNKEELALFGANYCLPSACDYRAAGYITNDRNTIVDQDMAHFARMGWDALRLCFWGDFENSDSLGNLIKNEHLQLLDYVIFQAKKRGIYFLLSPIVTYSSQWPDAMEDTVSAKGFSTHFKKSELGTNSRAIAAQQNFIRQLLNHVNEYTGIALKDEPNILFIEMINEPWHHSDDVEGSVKYINALVDAVRSTGCKKILFHNYSQDFKMAKALQQSKIQGISFAWYPSGLNSGYTLEGNYLPVVDHYSEQMLIPEVSKLARIVYEFDSPDLITGYMYPAMARTFRENGAQWASMFSYDMMATAPFNLGWQTHCLNMVYTPKKAVSAIVASEVMKTIPMYNSYGKYPANTRFGSFKVSYEEDLGELNTEGKFYYSNTTSTVPVKPATLRKIVGYGSSPVVNYEGKGIYFLDKIKDGTWRLEVYPDAVEVNDPFNMPSPDKVVIRSISRNWPMQISIPDLGKTFSVIAINKDNSYKAAADNGEFEIMPGVYILTSEKELKKNELPASIGNVGMYEYYAPSDQNLPIQVKPNLKQCYYEGGKATISANVFCKADPKSVTLFLKLGNWRYMPITMKKETGYCYKADIPENFCKEGYVEYCIVAEDGDNIINFPSGINKRPTDWDYYDVTTWKTVIIKEKTPLRLIEPATDAKKIAFTRIGDGIRFGIYKLIPSNQNGEPAIHLGFPSDYDKNLADYTLSIPIKDKVTSRQGDIRQANYIELEARGCSKKQSILITLVEKDGTSWSKKLELNEDWSSIKIPIKELELSKGVMLPLGYPGEWRYWFEPADGRGYTNDQIKIENAEWIQLSIRQKEIRESEKENNSWVELSSAVLKF
jgi:hypothetical protein